MRSYVDFLPPKCFNALARDVVCYNSLRGLSSQKLRKFSVSKTCGKTTLLGRKRLRKTRFINDYLILNTEQRAEFYLVIQLVLQISVWATPILYGE